MLAMITEETENVNTRTGQKEATESISGLGLLVKEENLTFPRRSRCSKAGASKVNWAEMLAKATEEDKKHTGDCTFPDDCSEDEENYEPNVPAPAIFHSRIKGSSDDMVLDLSSMNRSLEPLSTKKGYTLPSYQPQYKFQSQTPRGQPLKPFNSQSKNPCAVNNVKEAEVAAKKSLFSTREVYYEKEIVTQKHVSLGSDGAAPKTEFRMREVEYKQDPVLVTPRVLDKPPCMKVSGSAVTPLNPTRYQAVENISAPLESVRYQGVPGQTPSQHNQYLGVDSYQTPSHSLRYHAADHILTPQHPIEAVAPASQPVRCQTVDDNHAPQSMKYQAVDRNTAAVQFAVPERPHKPRPSTKELVVNGRSYQILALLGKGGSSKVYLVLAKDNSLLAIKCVNLGNVDEKTKRDHLNEIEHLMKMQYCRHIIKIIDHQYIPSRNLLLAVMERGDTDLSRILKERINSGEGVPPEMILFYWSEMLLAVKSIHDNNIIHRDLKPANFLLVSGRLKLIDFGIASAIQSEQTSVFKDSQSGTPNYMSPEAWEDLGEDDKRVVRIGRKTDVWSLGCILYSFLYGKTPFQEYNHPMAKFRAITNPNHKIPFPAVKGIPEMLIESCRRCLIYDKNKRASIEELLLLKSEALMTPPEILGKLRRCLNDAAFESAKAVILPTREQFAKTEDS